MKIETLTRRGAVESHVSLADTGAMPNTVNYEYAEAQGFKRVDWPCPKHFEYVNETLAPTRGVYAIRLRATDGRGQTRLHKQLFIGTDSRDYNIVLGMPALEDMGVVLDPRTKRWWYAHRAQYFEWVTPDRFEKTLRSGKVLGDHAFAVQVTPAGTVREPEAMPLAKVASIVKKAVQEQWARLKQTFKGVFQPPEEPKPCDGVAHEIETTADPPHGPIYNLSSTELVALSDYIHMALERGWISHSTSPAGAPILFVPKKDGTLRLCVDYRGLNKVTVKNRLALPLISEILDRVSGARVFSKIDLRDAYHRIPIRGVDRWKSAFRTRYGHFEYNVMPFGLTNAPATFQGYINKALAGLVDICCVVYLDDILIYSKDEEEHAEHLRLVLERLEQYALYANEAKCEFFVDEVEYLGFRIRVDGVQMDPSRVEAVSQWPTPTTHRELQVFLGFANFYRRFIEGYAHMSRVLTDKFKGGKGGKHFGPWTWSTQEDEAFRGLVTAFTTAPILRHYDPTKPLLMTTDASAFAMSAILEQPHGDRWHPIAYWSRKFTAVESRYDTHDRELLAIVSGFRHWRHYVAGSEHATTVRTDHNNLVAWSRIEKLNMRQSRWAMELMPIDFHIEYLKGKANPADAPSRRPDYAPGDAEMETKAAALVPVLKHKLGLFRANTESAAVQSWVAAETQPRRAFLPGPRSNPVPVGEAPTREEVNASSTVHPYWPEDSDSDKETLIGFEPDVQATGNLPHATLATPTGIARIAAAQVNPFMWENETENTMTLLIAELQRADPKLAAKRQRLATLPTGKRGRGRKKDPVELGGYTVRGEDHVLYFKEKRLCVPDDAGVKLALLQRYHDAPLAGHFGAERTVELLQRHYHWENMEREVQTYVSSCRQCQWTHAKRHRPYGSMQPLEPASAPWRDLSMDFITDLPACTVRGARYDAILVVVDRFTKMALYVPTRKDLRATGLADLIVDKVVSRFGVPATIVSDRGPVFTSVFWRELCASLQIRRRLSSAFHPQTDGQTERMNQTLEAYLRIFCNDKQDNWAALLPLAEFAYNASKHSVTKESPFFALMGYHPKASFEEFRVEDLRERLAGDRVPGLEERLSNLRNVHEAMATRLKQAVETMKRYAEGKTKAVSFKSGDYVMLSTKNLTVTQTKKKLAPKFLGPIQIAEAVGANAYRLRLPDSWKIHDVVSVAFLEKWTQRDQTYLPKDVAHDTLVTNEPPEGVTQDVQWEVEAILDRKRKGNAFFYKVKWAGDWAKDKVTWEPEEHARDADEVFDEFETAFPRESNLEKKAGTGRTRRKRRRRAY